MPSLAFFSSTSITPQTAALAYGVESADKFRVSSLFTVSTDTKAYAMMKGTILLQQQQGNNDKVNLVLRPHNQKEFKLPIKYVIYRGLKTIDFIDSNDLADPDNKVKTSGSELLAAMQVIQQDRAPGDDIPLEALFGNDLTPASNLNIDEFFFKNLALTSQLFTIDCGVELGNFSPGEIGVEIILENPEFFVDVELAKEERFEIQIDGNMSSAEKKWRQDLARHFADPAAFYGLHHDIQDGIEYRDSNGDKQPANTATLVYNNVLAPFIDTTRNTVYLDIRNENGYSYNYYDNYEGSGTHADKEIKIAETSDEIENPGNPNYNNAFKEYYTNGWAIHIVDITPGGGTENEFFIALRINDNEKPLLAGWNVELTPNSVINPPLTDNASSRVYFIDETILLPTPISEFTNTISIKVPNISIESAQLATIVKLDYIKQLRLNDGVDAFPQQNPTDYLFGPITAQIPWDSEDGVQWIGSSHHKYFDGLNHGFVSGIMEEDIAGLDPSLKTITINERIDAEIINKVYITNTTNPQNVGQYNVKKVETPNPSTTVITVLETFLSGLQSGDKLKFITEAAVSINYSNKKLIANDIDLTTLSAFSAGKRVKLFLKKGAESINEISNSTYISGNTEIVLTNDLTKQGLGSIMQTGMVSETDTSGGTPPPDNDNILFYSVPQFYFKNTGGKDNSFFNYKGATYNNESFIKTLQNTHSNFKIEKYSLQPSAGVFVATLAYDDTVNIKENILLLGLKKSEFEDLRTAAATQLSPYHLQMLKLKPQGNRLRDEDYEPYYKYHLVVAGLDNLGDYSETTVYKEIYSRDGLIFTSPEYASHIVADFSLELDFEERFHLNLQADQGEWNLVQLSTNPNSTFQYLYETIGADLKDIVDDFETEINALTTANFKTEIETKIKEKGTELLNAARTNIRNSSHPMYNKDGALYLARLQMRKMIKQQPLISASFVSYNNIRQYLDLLEKVTRGLHSSNLPDFSTHPDHIPILISGFDPFRAAMGGGGLDENYHLSNPSGNIALSLNNKVIPNGSANAIIKSVVFPVRYREFNNGWIEDFFEQYINLNHPNYQGVKMIITFSFGVDTYDFQIDRFASSYRNGYIRDNNMKLDLAQNLKVHNLNNKPFINNQLPYDELEDNGELVVDVSGNNSTIGINHRAYWKLFATDISGSSPIPDVDVTNNHTLSRILTRGHLIGQSVIPIDKIRAFVPSQESGNPQSSNETKYVTPTDNDFIRPPSWTDYPDTQPWVNDYTDFYVKSRMGSGQWYFSNEIHYRVSNVRDKYKSDLKTGHIHIGFLQGDREQMLEALEYIIKKMLNDL